MNNELKEHKEFQFIKKEHFENPKNLKTFIAVAITEDDMKSLIRIRNYFGENDKNPLEHLAFDVLNRIVTPFIDGINDNAPKHKELTLIEPIGDKYRVVCQNGSLPISLFEGSIDQCIEWQKENCKQL